MATTQMIIRLDSRIKSNLAQLAKAEGKNSSLVIRELIENYVQDRNIESYIDDLWNRVGKKLKRKNIKSKDIARTIRKVRATTK